MRIFGFEITRAQAVTVEQSAEAAAIAAAHALGDIVMPAKRVVEATIKNDALRDIKGGILTTTTQLVSTLTGIADQVAKFQDALKARDAAIDERDARIAQLEQALLTAKATSTDAPDLDSAVTALTAAATAAAAAAAAAPKPLTPVAADNITQVVTPPVLTTPVAA